MKLNIKSKPIRSQVLWKYTDDDRVYIVYKPHCMSLNETGSFIWENTLGDLTIEEIGEKMYQKLSSKDAGKEQVIADVLEFCDALFQAKLIYIDEFEEELL